MTPDPPSGCESPLRASPPANHPVTRRRFCRLLGGLPGLLAACNSTDQEPMPTRLRVEVLPDRSRTVLEKRYVTLLAHLSAKLKMPCDLMIPRDYAELVDDFAQGRSDLGLFGGYTFVLAGQRTKMVPLVLRGVDRHFTTVFLTAPSNRKRPLEDFKGQRFAFGPRLSTSGHLMARAFLQQHGIVPETFFKEVRYSPNHDETAFLVRDGVIDLGAASALAIKRLFERGEIKETDVFPLLETPPFTDYVWAMRESTPAALRSAVRAAFLSLTKLDESDARVLADQDAEIFLPALKDDFRRIESAARKLPAEQLSPNRDPHS